MLNSRLRKFFSYYKPYRRLLIADVACAFLVAAIALALPLFARHITGVILPSNAPDTVAQIVTTGAVMLALVLLQTTCNIFVDYQGHTLGAMIEADMRGELFDHYQKLSFSFYNEQKTGQLMSRLTHDLFAVSELYHHGPEEGIIALLKFVGAFFILLTINVGITLLIFLFLPLMALFALYWPPTTSSWRCRRATIPTSGSAVSNFPAGKNSALASPALSSKTRLSSSLTRRPARWTTRASAPCRNRWKHWRAIARRWSLPTA
jgi:ABC-type multidrug transport system fused ATPase/permease subunit